VIQLTFSGTDAGYLPAHGMGRTIMEQASAPASAKSASHAQTRKPGGTMGAKTIGALGAVLTVATVAAFMMSSSPQPSTSVAPQAATAVAAVSAPAPINVPAPVTLAAVTPPPAAAVAPAAPPQRDCKLLHRRFYMTGQGTIRLRTDGYVSPVISLSDTPQMVDLPMLRPTQGGAEQQFVFEGKAPFVILTTDYADFRQGLTIDGRFDYDMTWLPLKSC
jgi:hypothetical protein